MPAADINHGGQALMVNNIPFAGRTNTMDYRFDDDFIIPSTSYPPPPTSNDAIANALFELSNSVMAQSNLMSNYFGRNPNHQYTNQPTLQPTPKGSSFPQTQMVMTSPSPPQTHARRFGHMSNKASST